MYRNLLVAIDDSPVSRKALKAALRMARGWDARLHVLNVQPRQVAAAAGFAEAGGFNVDPADFERATRAAARHILERARRLAAAQGVKCRLIAETSSAPARAIVRAAKRARAGLIVTASHGRGRAASFLLGSTTQQVLATCRIPVLVYR